MVVECVMKDEFMEHCHNQYSDGPQSNTFHQFSWNLMVSKCVIGLICLKLKQGLCSIVTIITVKIHIKIHFYVLMLVRSSWLKLLILQKLYQ